MAAGAPGQGGRLDQATLSLRLALLHAEEESDRLRALAELSRGRVFAATWPRSPEAIRTLTNSDGEQAMPLFSGVDTLQRAARRFGWIEPDGSLAFRELGAREALEGALSQGVHYVVLDIYADHAAEFARHEIGQVLTGRGSQPQPAAAVPATGLHSRRTGSAGEAGAAHEGPALGDVDTPFVREPASRGVTREITRELVAPRRSGGLRADPRAEPLPPGAHALAQVELKRAPCIPVEHAAPPPPPPAGAPAIERLPELDAAPAALPEADAPPAIEPPLGFGLGEPEPEARPAALEAAAVVAQVGKLADDEATQRAAAEVAAMLKDMARKGVTEDAAPSPAQSAASAFASLLSSELSADARRTRRRKPSDQQLQAVEPPAQAQAEPLPEGALRPLDPPLDEAVLDAVAEALRHYPEVEWACALSDGSARPLIALRVDAAFQARAADIEAAVARTAQQHGSAVSVRLLGDPAAVRDARAHGAAFFPWRKRAAKR